MPAFLHSACPNKKALGCPVKTAFLCICVCKTNEPFTNSISSVFFCYKDTGYPWIDSDLVLKKVDKNTELAEKLIRFVEQFSWEDVKEHLLHILHTWEYTDWETPFVAMVDGETIIHNILQIIITILFIQSYMF